MIEFLAVLGIVLLALAAGIWIGAHPTEAKRSTVINAQRVANPGCFPAATLTALAPLLMRSAGAHAWLEALGCRSVV